MCGKFALATCKSPPCPVGYLHLLEKEQVVFAWRTAWPGAEDPSDVGRPLTSFIVHMQDKEVDLQPAGRDNGAYYAAYRRVESTMTRKYAYIEWRLYSLLPKDFEGGFIYPRRNSKFQWT